MRYLAMTIPALPVFPHHCHFGIHCFHEIVGKNLLVAPDAVLFYNFLPGIEDHDYLRFSPHGENSRMTHSIPGLEIKLVYSIIVRNMTIVAMSHLTV